jgi:formate-dependent nitrite reductase cytochrome c552 subunit
MIGLFKRLAPPERWRLPVIIVSGILAGLFFYLGYISRVASYLSDDPSTCMNCHIMAPQYATWNHSAHREKTNCNDCHVPHNNVLNKYFFKAKDGIRHAQWRWDYAAASHGGSFHSPLEISRVIGTGIHIAQEGRIKLGRLLYSLGHREEVPYPPISSKEEAQIFIGMNAEELQEEKKLFLKTVVPEWDSEAAEREANYSVKSLFE